MARPRKATNILELNGAFRHDPKRGRERENEPVPLAEIGPCPVTLDPDEVVVWEDMVSRMPYGVLGDCDRDHLEVVVRLMAYTRRVPVEEWEAAKIARLDAMLGKLGMNPADRSKVKAEKAPPKNAFRDL